MIEDKLSQEQRIRLEAVAQANAGHFGTTTSEMLKKADLIEKYIRYGKIPEDEDDTKLTNSTLASVSPIQESE